MWTPDVLHAACGPAAPRSSASSAERRGLISAAMLHASRQQIPLRSRHWPCRQGAACLPGPWGCTCSTRGAAGSASPWACSTRRALQSPGGCSCAPANAVTLSPASAAELQQAQPACLPRFMACAVSPVSSSLLQRACHAQARPGTRASRRAARQGSLLAIDPRPLHDRYIGSRT